MYDAKGVRVFPTKFNRVIEDGVDRIRSKTGRPRDDASVVAVVSRLYRLMGYVDRTVTELFGRHGLTHGEANVLGALQTANQDSLTPGRLSSLVMCSAGAMTNRLDRLEQDGLIVRSPDPADRRGTRIAITKAGRLRIRAALAEREGIDDTLVPGLTKSERRTMIALLRKILAEYEPSEA